VTPRFITGFGVCSTRGVGREEFFAAMRSGTPLPAEQSMAEVPDFDPMKWLGDKGLRTLDRLTKLMIVAARLAADDAGLKKDNVFVRSSPERVGLCCSNAYGSLEAITELNRVAQLEDARYINPAKFPNTVANSASGYVSIWEEFRALNISISDGNCGALDAFTMADIYLGQDRADAILVGGGEASSEALYLAFSQLGVLETAARLGEGAAFVVLEKENPAKENHKAMATICGASSAHGAPDNEQRMIHASGDALTRAIKSALAEANTSAADVDLVVSGVSGLRVFDRVETSAIRRALREDVAIAAPKRILGETLGAGGAMATVAALAYLAGAQPTPIVHGVLRKPLRTLVLTSMGYYGNASAVVMKAP
jgi:3-oxoacyl-(acyl-carrier-protein) synthase